MNKLTKLWRRFLFVLRRDKFDRELSEEMQFHLALKIEENKSKGMSQQEARSDAIRRFGNVTRMQETSREIWLFRTVEVLVQDLRYAVRVLIKQPVFTVVAIIALALGIGMNTAIFSVINAVLIKPLPYDRSEQLVWMAETGEIPDRHISYMNFKDWRDRNNVFEAIACVRGWQMTITGLGDAENLTGQMVSADFFRVFHATPYIGRGFTDEDERSSALVTVISYEFWQKSMSADPYVLNKTITMDDQLFKVIGVMPSGFRYSFDASMWVLTGGNWNSPSEWASRDVRTAGYMVARLKPGISLPQAHTEMTAISDQLFKQYPVANAGHNSVHMLSLLDSVTRDVRSILLILFCAVGLVLLIACANVANLLMARTARRQKEFSLRVALGASRWRIIRQLLTENILLGITGGVIGLILSWWSIRTLVALQQDRIPRLHGVSLDSSVLGFTLIVSVLTGIVFGLAPAWQTTKIDLNETLKDCSRTSTESSGHRLRSALVIIEVALSLMLLIGSGLMIKSMVKLIKSDPGFDPHNVVTMKTPFAAKKYPSKALNYQFQQQLLERVAAIPGVEHAAITNDLPGFTSGWQNDIAVEGRRPIKRGELINVDWTIASEDYFDTMRLSILRGRTFTHDEVANGRPVVLVDENLAREFWPNGDALGKHIAYDSPTWHEIIGIVKEVKVFGTEVHPLRRMYTPLGRFQTNRSTLCIRTASAEPTGIVTAVNSELKAIDPDVPLTEVATMNEVLEHETSPKRFTTILLGVFAAIALILAAVGIYGVMSYSVAQRTHEIGIRMALGAQKADVFKLILTQGMTRIIIGVVTGVIAALLLTRVMKSLLYGVSATDPVTFASVAVILMLVALLACYLPARRATRMDPMIALRYE